MNRRSYTLSLTLFVQYYVVVFSFSHGLISSQCVVQFVQIDE